MKHRILIALTIVTVLVSSVVLTACYPSKPTQMKNLVGTYKLDSFTRTYDSDVDKEGNHISRNMIEDWKIKSAYLVVTGEEYGYYVYVDDSGTHTNIVKLTYTYDEENSDKVKELGYTTGSDTTATYPTSGKETLGVYYTWSTKTLNYNMPSIFGRKYSQSVRYTKVDKGTDLAYVNKALKTDLSPAPYEVALLEGWQTFRDYYANTPYIYYFVNMRLSEKKADVYYALKSDGQRQQELNVDVDYAIGEVGTPITVTVGNKTFYCDNNGIVVANALYMQQDYHYYFNRVDRESFDLEMEISITLADYASYMRQS